MAKARQELELTVRIGNQPGELAKLFAAIAEAGINILAYCAYSERNQGVVLLVTENIHVARQALESAGYSYKITPVVLVSNADHVGAVAAVGEHLGSAGINILYSYASSAGADRFYAVFKTDDNDSAIRVIEKAAS